MSEIRVVSLKEANVADTTFSRENLGMETMPLRIAQFSMKRKGGHIVNPPTCLLHVIFFIPKALTVEIPKTSGEKYLLC